jgi:hypothetical protein
VADFADCFAAYLAALVFARPPAATRFPAGSKQLRAGGFAACFAGLGF